VRYLGQIGGTEGAAIVGTVVNLSLATDLDRRLPEAAVTHRATVFPHAGCLLAGDLFARA